LLALASLLMSSAPSSALAASLLADAWHGHSHELAVVVAADGHGDLVLEHVASEPGHEPHGHAAQGEGAHRIHFADDAIAGSAPRSAGPATLAISISVEAHFAEADASPLDPRETPPERSRARERESTVLIV
jgi:hypothetical protein